VRKIEIWMRKNKTRFLGAVVVERVVDARRRTRTRTRRKKREGLKSFT
jgi:hypothetical protein